LSECLIIAQSRGLIISADQSNSETSSTNTKQKRAYKRGFCCVALARLSNKYSGFIKINCLRVKRIIPNSFSLFRLKMGTGTHMKYDLNRRELQLIRLWWLSCEDMMVPNGTCTSCEFKDECEVIRLKLYGRRNNKSTIAPLVNVCNVKHDS